MGTPTTGPGSIPTLPGQDPYDIDRFGRIDDPADWQLWWAFNQDRFLNYGSIDAGSVYTEGGFSFGEGTELADSRAGRVDDALIDSVLVGALRDALLRGGSFPFCRNALVASAKLGGDRAKQFDYATDFYLRQNDLEMSPTAAFVRGLAGGDADVTVLREIALNTFEGCKAISPKGERPTPRVPVGVRAFACYGLGVIGSRTKDVSVKQRIVQTLVEVLENDSGEANDGRVAAMIALGLVPLPVDPDVVACYCGTCVVPDPHTSLRPQVTYLMRYFTAQKEFDPVLRAHTATTLGRLVAARPEGMTERMKEGVAEVLIRALASSSRQPEQVRESAVLALGLFGDADDDSVDQWIRWALRRAARTAEPMEKRFALISLAEVGGHSGQGEEPFAALGEIRGVLSSAAKSGKREERAWAAIALGVLGHQLRLAGEPLDPEVDQVLINAIRRGKTVDDLGSFALAAGLRRSDEAAAHLMKRLGKIDDEATGGYVAMGLGLIGPRGHEDSLPTLRAAFAEADEEPLLQTRIGLGLGFLRDPGVVDDLIARLETLEAGDDEAEEGGSRGRRSRGSKPKSDEEKEADEKAKDAEMSAIVKALGYLGDKRGLEAISRIAKDEKAEYPGRTREAAIVALGHMGDRSKRPWRVALTMGANYRAQTPSLTTSEGKGVLDLR